MAQRPLKAPFISPIADTDTGKVTPEWLNWLQFVADAAFEAQAAIVPTPIPGPPGSDYGTGTAGRITKWLAAHTLGDSIISESGSMITVAGGITAVTINARVEPSGINTGGLANAFLISNATAVAQWSQSVPFTVYPTTSNTVDLGRVDRLWRHSYLAGQARFTNGNAAPVTMATNTAAFYAADVSGTTRLFAIDEAGVTGQLATQVAALTPGSVVFAAADGRLTQDNANFFWDAATHRLGLGLTTPSQRLEVNGNIFINANNGGIAVAGITPQSNRIITGDLLGFGTAGLGVTHLLQLFSSRFRLVTPFGEVVSILDANGAVGLGVTAPTAILHLKAGTATANNAPLKLTSGVLLATPEAGAVEFVTDTYYATITTGAARKGIVLDNGARLTATLLAVATTNGRLVDGPANAAGVLTNNGSGVLTWVPSSGGTVTGTGTVDRLAVWTSSTAIGNSAVAQDASLNVGIGTTTPSTVLAVNLSSFRLLNILGTSGTAARVVVQSNGSEATLDLVAAGEPLNLKWASLASGSSVVTLRVMNDAGTIRNTLFTGNLATNVMTFSQVGVNTPSPSQQFEVTGVSRFTGTVQIGGAASGITQLGGSTGAIQWNGQIGTSGVDTSNPLFLGYRSGGAGSADLLRLYTDSQTTPALFVKGTGNVGVGTTAPTAFLHFKAGTTTANSAPLKFTSGSLQLTAEAGAVEFLTDTYYATITTGAARKGIVLDDGARLTATRLAVATTNGRLIDGPANAAGVLTNDGVGGLSWVAGGGGGVTGSGTAGKIAKWSTSTALTNSIMTETTALITIAGALTIDGPLRGAWNGAASSEEQVGIGVGALGSLAAGSFYNTAFGYNALNALTTARYNTAVGAEALSLNTVNFSTAVGFWALKVNTTGAENTAIGSMALSATTTGGQNIAIGGGSSAALLSNTTGSENVAIGVQACRLATDAVGNTGIGFRALANATATLGKNTAIGHNAGQFISTGTENTCVGAETGLTWTTGTNNTGLGSRAGDTLTTGTWNTFVGYVTGNGITTGNYNTIIGANVTALAAGLSNNVILADGQGNKRLVFSNAGVMTIAWFGDHAITATGTGRQSLTLRNQSAGTANDVAVMLGNDSSATLAYFRGFSSTFTSSGPSIQSGAQVVSEGAGGLSLCATAGPINYFPGGTSVRGRMHASGGFSWGDLTDPGLNCFRVAGTTTLGGALSVIGTAILNASSFVSSGVHFNVGASAYTGRTIVNPTNAINIWSGIAPVGTTGGANFCTLYCRLDAGSGFYKLYYMDSNGVEFGPLT